MSKYWGTLGIELGTFKNRLRNFWGKHEEFLILYSKTFEDRLRNFCRFYSKREQSPAPSFEVLPGRPPSKKGGVFLLGRLFQSKVKESSCILKILQDPREALEQN